MEKKGIIKIEPHGKASPQSYGTIVYPAPVLPLRDYFPTREDWCEVNDGPIRPRREVLLEKPDKPIDKMMLVGHGEINV